jgi:UDP-N-acetyl-D-glucosamine dehydrogenase
LIDPATSLGEKLTALTARVAVIGLGYTGLPLALALVRAGFPVLGVDTDPEKPRLLRQRRSYIRQIPDADIAAACATGRFEATGDRQRLAEADAIIICVPTPLSRQREPDLQFVIGTATAILDTLRPGQLVILESTTWPGTTGEVVRPILERSGLRCGTDIFLAYSPEREDPGNKQFTTRTIPKLVGADDAASLDLGCRLYAAAVASVVPMSSSRAAEAAKLTENIFRGVNIALMNELKTVFAPMGIDIWEVIDAARTKPFGFMPFYPGPGLGGHCIPIDPFYLTWKAREYGIATRFIELAGEINTRMPLYVVDRLARALDDRQGRGLNGTRILVLGVAYKKNVDDTREAPALRIMELLEERGGAVDFHDPLVPVLPPTRDHPALAGRPSVPLTPQTLSSYDAALIVTDHDAVDYDEVVRHSRIVVDTRNATRQVAFGRERIVAA